MSSYGNDPFEPKSENIFIEDTPTTARPTVNLQAAVRPYATRYAIPVGLVNDPQALVQEIQYSVNGFMFDMLSKGMHMAPGSLKIELDDQDPTIGLMITIKGNAA